MHIKLARADAKVILLASFWANDEVMKIQMVLTMSKLMRIFSLFKAVNSAIKFANPFLLQLNCISVITTKYIAKIRAHLELMELE